MSTLEQHDFKQLVKEAVKEVMLENSDLIKDLLVDALEEIALLQRIEEGRQTEFVSRDEVMEILEQKH
jgi:hypothetical protein